MSSNAEPEASQCLAGLRIALAGKLAGMTKREAQQLVRSHGGVPLDKPDASADLIVVGEADFPLGDGDVDSLLDDSARAAVDRGRTEVMTETRFWEKLGLVELEQDIHRLYTPAMLAGLVGVPLEVIRRWHRRKLILPVRDVKRLPYFDFQEVTTARRLAEMLAGGMSPAAIEKKLAALGRILPHVERPLAQLSVIVQGKEILLRQGGGLLAPGGQYYIDFDAESLDDEAGDESHLVVEEHPDHPASAEEMLDAAAELEDEGSLEAACDMVRAALAAAGPNAETCFRLAELLYRRGDVPAARERYYMAIELDEDYVEARANLGCVLAELGQRELALAAFEGALRYHPDYPDAHYHLAQTLDELDRPAEAEIHWREFLALAPQSPWAAEARARLDADA